MCYCTRSLALFFTNFHIHGSLMFKSTAKIFVFVSLLFIFNSATASPSDALYEVDILVTDESANVRWGAFKQGLDQVFVRISGDSIIMDKLKRPAPTTYVKQYSYDPVDEPTTDAQGQTLSHRIKIQYNGRAMEKYLQENGFPVWGEHRPDVVIWLAVRDGRNEYVLKSSDQSLIKAAADEALVRRGVPQKWPLYDKTDKKVLKVADIRGGFKDPVNKASKRYSRGPALTGSMIWNGQQWQSSWSLLMGSSNRHWSLVDTDYNRLINKAIDQAADAMGIVYAVHGSAGKQKLASLQLDVQGVDSIEKYRGLENYLSDLNAVEMARPLRVDAQNVLFEVLLRTDASDFRSSIKSDAKLAEMKAPAVKEKALPGVLPGSESLPADMSSEASSEAPPGNPSATNNNAANGKTAETQVTKLQSPVYYYKLIK